MLCAGVLLGVAAQAQTARKLTVNLTPDGAANMQVFLPQSPTGRAIVGCPGGGYSHLSMQNEGTDWADFFTGQGVAVAVLKYRLPHGDADVPMADAMEAVRLVRRKAGEWRVDPRKVGIMGFSAGGHLASLVATKGEGDAAPDFQILFYPVITMNPGFTHRATHDNLLGEKPKKKREQEMSTDRCVSRVTPRAYIALCDDDHTVLPANGVNYYLACYRHDVPASLHVYPAGGHGWGMRADFTYHIEMLLDLKAWLGSL